MKKTIRLTESDLVKLVNRVIKEQGAILEPRPEPKPEIKNKPLPDPVGKVEKRPFDKMVGECLENAGFIVKYGKNQGEYALDAFKRGTVKGDYNVRSIQGNPSKFIYTLRTPEGKVAKKEISVNSSTTCKSIVP